MCRINITLNTTPGDLGAVITSAQGRYKTTRATRWTNFPIDLSDPKTPNITTIGTYDLEVNVTNNLNNTSNWAQSTFSISDDCNPGPVDPVRIICPNTEPYNTFEHRNEFIQIVADPELLTWTATVAYRDRRNTGWVDLNPSTTSGNGTGEVLFDINAAPTIGSSVGVREADITITDINNSSNNKICTIQQYYYTNDFI